MSFRLTIEFAGMCLFVRDRSRNRISVLLPRVLHQHHGNGPHVDHFARLFYHPVHEPTRPPLPGGAFHELLLDGQVLNLAGLAAPFASPPALDSAVVGLSQVLATGGYLPQPRVVPRTVLDNPLQRELARVELDSGTLDPARIERGARWRLLSASGRQMAISGVWTIPAVNAGFLNVGVGTGSRTLTPVTRPDGSQEIALHVFNAPANERPDTILSFPVPVPNERVEHFRAYYDLFNGVPGDTDVPTFHDMGTFSVDAKPPAFFGRRYTCIMAQADGEP